jgi:SecD/SecF fusion protein
MIFKASEITLTLPGIAGFILSIGMAVDANILIFERLREEIRNGKPLHTAVEDGFKRAWPSIRDSNISTAITCLVLIGFGSGPVKGFAITLLLGVAVSMFTAITVTHLLLDRVVQYPGTHKLSLFGVTKKYLASANIHRDLMGKMPLWFGISLLLIIPGAITFISEGGLKLGIDFTGGSYIEAHFTEAKTTTQVAEALRKDLGIESQVQAASDGRIAFIRTKPVQILNLKDEKGVPVNDLTFQKMVTDSLAKSVGSLAVTKEGDTERPVVSYSAVGPVIASEISQNAVKGIIFASLVILVYLAFVFKESTFADGVKFGACAIIAMIHDVLVLIGMMALAGALWGWEVDSLFITAALTVIGFSVHDSIVVFDRTRENWKMRAKGQSYQDIVNKSVLQTFRRSMFTSLTVLIVLAAMLAFGTGSNTAMTVFVSALLVGIASGTYSSVFNASPLLVLWDARVHGRQLAAASAGSGAVPLVPKNQAASPPQSESPSGAAARSGIEVTVGGSPEDKASAGTAKAKPSVKRKRRF